MAIKNPLLIKLGKVVQSERRKAGMSQESLAELADVHRTYIGMIERAEKNVTLTSLQKISQALRVPMSSILRRVEKL